MNLNDYGRPCVAFPSSGITTDVNDQSCAILSSTVTTSVTDYHKAVTVAVEPERAMSSVGGFQNFAFKELPLLEAEGLWVSASLSIDSPLFWAAWRIISTTFKGGECRSLAQQIEAIKAPNYRFSAIRDGDQVVGAVGIWLLDGAYYLEHLAISSEQRSAGYGTRIMQLLQERINGRIVLDVELPQVSGAALRRIAFYQRLGFTLDPQAVYVSSYRDTSLSKVQLMSWPAALPSDDRQHFLELIEPELYDAAHQHRQIAAV